MTRTQSNPSLARLLRACLFLFSALCAPAASGQALQAQDELRVMTWNIWHGGREDGEEVGPKKVVDVLRESGADLIAMQETYGSGELISAALGFHFQPRGTNVSIHSRYPILEDISVHAEFQCVGALVALPDGRRVAFYSIWLPYSAEIWEVGTRDIGQPDSMLAACEASASSLREMHKLIEAKLAAPRFKGVSTILAGDFNSMSHLDYGEVGLDQYSVSLDWPTSNILPRAGFRDSYRECNPRIDRGIDSTWTPRFPAQEQDRIDFIHYRSSDLRAVSSTVLKQHPEGFPSDHAALLSVFEPRAAAVSKAVPLRVMTFNIRHGVGLDNVLDLQRTGDTIAASGADIVALQEVDLRAERSGGRNQVLDLAEQLSMHPAFGAFMEFQGGHYGMAVLSKLPIVRVESFKLPPGGEPRIALLVEVRLPNDETLLVANVHFDWLADDRDRFAQASLLAAHLKKLERPYLLLGDFNDGPASRTLELFQAIAEGPPTDAEPRRTFVGSEPGGEIDFIFRSPAAAWTLQSLRVLDSGQVSDHRPVLAELTLLGG